MITAVYQRDQVGAQAVASRARPGRFDNGGWQEVHPQRGLRVTWARLDCNKGPTNGNLVEFVYGDEHSTSVRACRTRPGCCSRRARQAREGTIAHAPGWRNGKRNALKMHRGQPHEGSTPSPGTTHAKCPIRRLRSWTANPSRSGSRRKDVASGVGRRTSLACGSGASRPMTERSLPTGGRDRSTRRSTGS